MAGALGLEHDEVGIHMHPAVGTFGRDVLHLAAAVEVVDAAVEDAADRAPLLRIELLGGGEHPAQARHAAAGRLDELGEARHRRGIAEGDGRAERRPAAQPRLHLPRTGMKGIELVHAAGMLTQLELQARHPLQPFAAAPEKADHFAEPPPALQEVPVGAGIGCVHVDAFAIERQRDAGRSAAVMPLKPVERHVLPDEVAPPLPDNVLRQNG